MEKEILSEHIPALKVWYLLIGLYLFQSLIFFLSMIFFWWISSTFLIGALIGELIVVLLGILPYHYLILNIKNIRENYKKKYGKLAGQYFWFKYESYTIPLLSSSLYFPLLLITYEKPSFQLIKMPSHIITSGLLPVYIAPLIGIIFVLIGLLIRRPSGGFGPEIEIYLHLLFPENGRLITNGIYRYIRHPRYLGRGFISVGLGIIANNIIAISVGIIHFLVFSSLIYPEENELSRRFGKDYFNYKKKVPLLIPKYGNLNNFVRFIIKKKKLNS
jgi:protein-S-isoprenylcysteine O-methyltransferase Ste14